MRRIVLAVVTGFGALAALAEGGALAVVLVLLAAGSIALAVGFVAGAGIAVTIGGWLLVFSALAAFYTAGAMMLAGSTGGRTILPLGTYRVAANVPGRRATEPVEYAAGMPGAKVGQ